MLACGAASGQDFDEFVINAGFRVEQEVLVADLYGDSRRMSNTWRSTRWIRSANRAPSRWSP
jgi:hypothetical protein